MNYWKHSLLSKKKFGGEAHDYVNIHKFIDSSKLFYFNIKHRTLIHNTFGMELSIVKFGDFIINSNNNTILVRDIVAEHCKEDLFGAVPTLNNWFKYANNIEIEKNILNLEIKEKKLNEFILIPYLLTGLKSTLYISHSNFGIYLIKEVLGLEYAEIYLRKYYYGLKINEIFQFISFKEKWQFTPDLKQLKKIEECT